MDPPFADLDPPTELRENIILNVLVEINNTLRFSAYLSTFLIQNMRIADAYELAARNDPSDVFFDQGKMCKHLVQCSEKGTFSVIVEHR